MLLHQLPKFSRFCIKDNPAEYVFYHTDGAYSVCTDKDGHIFHFSVNTPVEVVSGLKDQIGVNNE